MSWSTVSPEIKVSDIWSYSTRTLTAMPRYVTVGKALLIIKDVVDSGVYESTDSETINLLSVPSGEVWLVYYAGTDASFYLYDGVNQGDVPIGTAGKLAGMLPLNAGWALRVTFSTAGQRARALAFKLDPSQVSVLGGVVSIPADTVQDVLDAANKYRVFMHGTTKGDGTNAGTILAYHGKTTNTALASGTGNVNYFGAVDEFLKISIRNEAAAATKCDVVALEVSY